MKKIVLIFILFSSLLLFLLFRFSASLEREVRIFASTTGKTRLSSYLYGLLGEKLSERNENFIEISRDSFNGVTSIQLHATDLNRFAQELSFVLCDELSTYKGEEFGIPLGNLSGLALFSGKGPYIPVEAIVVGGIANEISSEFISAGINQTLHRVSLTYSIAVRYLSPMHDAFDSITLSVIVAETLIVGDVPIYKD